MKYEYRCWMQNWQPTAEQFSRNSTLLLDLSYDWHSQINEQQRKKYVRFEEKKNWGQFNFLLSFPRSNTVFLFVFSNAWKRMNPTDALIFLFSPFQVPSAELQSHKTTFISVNFWVKGRIQRFNWKILDIRDDVSFRCCCYGEITTE